MLYPLSGNINNTFLMNTKRVKCYAVYSIYLVILYLKTLSYKKLQQAKIVYLNYDYFISSLHFVFYLCVFVHTHIGACLCVCMCTHMLILYAQMLENNLQYYSSFHSFRDKASVVFPLHSTQLDSKYIPLPSSLLPT